MTAHRHPLIHPFTPAATPESEMISIVRAKGSTLWDDKGNDYLDGLAGLWYCQIGYGRPEMAEAVADQMRRLATFNTFLPFTNRPAARIAEMVLERSPISDGGRVFLACSGSEAVDTALKLARLHAQRSGSTERQLIIRRTNGYHGTNFGGTTAQGIALNRADWGDLIPHFLEVPNDDIEAMSVAFAKHGERVAAVVSEPVQGAGGVFPPPEGYLEGVRKLCDQHGALMIADEVITGFGRTGEWFASQTFDVTPDLIAFAKGVTSGYMPLSGVIVNRAVCESLEEPGYWFRHGYTYSGHPTTCAAAVKNIEIIEDENLLERAVHVGRRIEEGLDSLIADGLIASKRGTGALQAAELGRHAVPLRDEMRRRGVIVRAIETALAICPPLVITDNEIGRIIDTMADALTSIPADNG